MKLGLDQSYTCTGVCIADDTGAIRHFGTFTTDSTKDVFDRSVQLAEFVVSLINTWNIASVHIEGLAFGMRGSATRDLAGLQFAVINAIRQHSKSVEVKIIAPTSLKKFATGTGKSTKADMISAVPDHILTMFSAKHKKTKGLADVVDAFWLATHP